MCLCRVTIQTLGGVPEVLVAVTAVVNVSTSLTSVTARKTAGSAPTSLLKSAVRSLVP